MPIQLYTCSKQSSVNTHMHLQENEVVSVSGDGRTVNLLHPLRYTHHGVTEMYKGGHFIDIR